MPAPLIIDLSTPLHKQVFLKFIYFQNLLKILSMALSEYIQNLKKKAKHKRRNSANSAPCKGKTMILPWSKHSF